MAKVVALEQGDKVGMPTGRDADARRFYGQILGMRETMRPPGERGVWFAMEGGTFAVVPQAEFKPRSDAPQARFRVDKVEPLRAALQRARFRDYDAPHVVGTRGCHALDPFGNRVELRERPDADS